MKILAVIVNFGNEQLKYLEKVVSSLKEFKKHEVTIIVQSNIPINNNLIEKVNIIEMENYQLLPLTCRSVIWKYRNDFDIFIYGENDHLFLEHHVDKHLEYSKILPKNIISGLVQYEENEYGRYYPGYHLDFDWDYNSRETYDGKIFAHFNNVHQASFILTREQLKRIGGKFDFRELVDENTISNRIIRKLKKRLGFKLERINKYSVKCKVNTDVFIFGGMKKMICISEFEDNLIHHIPNLYIEGRNGRLKLRSSQERMEASLKKLLNKK